jgi:hypothetical protein
MECSVAFAVGGDAHGAEADPKGADGCSGVGKFVGIDTDNDVGVGHGLAHDVRLQAN